jgi:hypothetical protein
LISEEPLVLARHLVRSVAVVAALVMTVAGAAAFDETKYPDWSGQWWRPRGVGFQWDQTKPPGLGQQAPLTPQYQAVLEASLADQAAGGQGGDNLVTCRTNGMPRMMSVAWPIEFVILPNVTYVHFEVFMPRRIYTDGREFPRAAEPGYMGYSIGKWLDTDGDGRFDTLEVETRNFKGPRTYEPSGIPLHEDNQSIIKERISLDKADRDILHNEITVYDHALTRPWTVDKRYRRLQDVLWYEDNCTEESSRHRRQGRLLRRRRRLPDAVAKGPAAAGPALLQAEGVIVRSIRRCAAAPYLRVDWKYLKSGGA